MLLAWPFPKDPDETADYSVSWSRRLGARKIVASTWTVPAGLTAGLDFFNDYRATIWLSGGTAGQTYTLVNHITTDGDPADEFDQSVTLTVQEA